MTWDRVNKLRALVWGAWGLVLLVGLGGLFVWHTNRAYEQALEAFSAQVGSPDYRDYSPAPVADEVNAALAFEKASAQLEVDPGWLKMPEPAAWSEATALSARELLIRNRLQLEDLVAAGKLPTCAWPAGAEVDTEPLVALLRASRLLRVEAFSGVLDRDEARVRRAFGALNALAECLYSAPHLTGSLIAASVERSELEVVHAASSSPSMSSELMQGFEAELEALLEQDRVRRAVAVEGALALRLLEEQRAGDSALLAAFRSVLFKRMSSALALRWIELAVWSRRPLEDLLDQSEALDDRKGSIAGIVADLVMPNVRHAIVGLRTNQALVELALFAVGARLSGERQGDYEGAFETRPDLGVLKEADGSLVLIDRELEALLREHAGVALEDADPNAQSRLDLTVWRLPPAAGSSLSP